MADGKDAKKPAKPAAGAAPGKKAAAEKPAAAKKAAAPKAKAPAPAPASEAAPEAAPAPKKAKRPKPPRAPLAPAAERRAALALAVAKPQGKPAKPAQRVQVTQLGSPIGRQDYQLATLKGLGLNRRHRTRVLEDTPSVRGMIERIRHLLRVEPAR